MSSIQTAAELSFRLEGADWSLVLEKDVVRFLIRQTQRGFTSHERIGQLFSRDLSGSRLAVSAATKLAPRRSSYASVTIDVQRMATERRSQFGRGLHFVGLWHTHPEPDPTPSELDCRLAADHATAASDLLTGIVFIIVGNLRTPESLRVWVHESGPPSTAQRSRLLQLHRVPSG